MDGRLFFFWLRFCLFGGGGGFVPMGFLLLLWFGMKRTKCVKIIYAQPILLWGGRWGGEKVGNIWMGIYGMWAIHIKRVFKHSI